MRPEPQPLRAFAHLRAFDRAQPDGLLVDLAAMAELGQVLIESRPRPGNHGRHVITWRQDGRTRTVEASTLAAALRRALAASRPRSAQIRP